MEGTTDGADLRADRPTPAELLEIIAETLTEAVVPATAPHAQHQARVAANLARILSRELAVDADHAPPMPDLPPSLVELDDHDAAVAFDQVKRLVKAKLAVNKPGYDAHDAAAEAAAVR